MSRRRAFFVSYYFPPLGGIGAHRSVKFIKYLAAFGWDVTVLTVQEGVQYIRDESLFDDLPASVKIVRARTLDVSCVRGWIKRVKPARLRKQLDYRFSLCLVPDDAMFWRWPAFFKALWHVRSCDVIFSTAGPCTSHLVARDLRVLTGKPWVADFRDEWTMNPYVSYLSQRQARLNGRMEASVLRHADAVTFAAEGFERKYSDAYPEYRSKLSTIWNGFDPEDVAEFRDKVNPDRSKFTIRHVGSMYKDTKPDVFYRSLRGLLDGGQVAADKICLDVVGNYGWPLFEYPGVEVKNHGYVPHREAIRLMCRSDLLLLFVPETRGKAAHTGKVFDYMGSHRSILAMIPPGGDLERMLDESGLARVVAYSDEETIAEELGRLYRTWERKGSLRGEFVPNDEAIDRYSRKEGARQLAEKLVSLVRR